MKRILVIILLLVLGAAILTVQELFSDERWARVLISLAEIIYVGLFFAVYIGYDDGDTSHEQHTLW